MSNQVLEMTFDEFIKKFGNSVEIVERIKNSKFKAFTKIAIKDEQPNEVLNAIKDAATNIARSSQEINQNTKSIIDNVNKASSKVASIIGSVTGVLDLCATVVGFAIVTCEINRLSTNLQDVMKVVLEEHELETFYKLDKVVLEYKAMLDADKIEKEYSEDRRRELIDDEYAVLKLLMGTFMRDTCNNKQDILYAIVSLSSMMACTITNFDEIYYYNHKDKQKWYSFHDTWMSIYDELVSDAFKNKIQDYMFLERGFNQYESDLGVVAITDNFYEAKQNIADKQKLIASVDTLNNYKIMLNYINSETVKEINDVIQNLGLDKNELVQNTVRETVQTLELYS